MSTVRTILATLLGASGAAMGATVTYDLTGSGAPATSMLFTSDPPSGVSLLAEAGVYDLWGDEHSALLVQSAYGLGVNGPEVTMLAEFIDFTFVPPGAHTLTELEFTLVNIGSVISIDDFVVTVLSDGVEFEANVIWDAFDNTMSVDLTQLADEGFNPLVTSFRLESYFLSFAVASVSVELATAPTLPAATAGAMGLGIVCARRRRG